MVIAQNVISFQNMRLSARTAVTRFEVFYCCGFRCAPEEQTTCNLECSVEADMCPITNGGSVLVKGNFVSYVYWSLWIHGVLGIVELICAHLNDSDLGRPKCVSTVYYSNKKKEHVKHAQTQMYVSMLTILCYIFGNTSQLYYWFC